MGRNDYIGEAGVGIFHYDGKENFTSVYPERLGYIGDIDLIGNRRPISYFREIVYGLTDRPYIAVGRMERIGQKASKTAWMFKDNISSWTWAGHENQIALVDVYSSGDEVELFLNGESLGKRQQERRNILRQNMKFHTSREFFGQWHTAVEKRLENIRLRQQEK